MSSAEDAPDDLLRERAGQSQLKLWVLLEASRWLVAAMLLGIVFGGLVGIGYLSPGAEAAIRTDDSVDTLFQALLGATITGVTLVLTLNQLVLSQELGPVKDQRERMEGAMQFREDVTDVIRAPVSPSEPSEFLRALVRASGERAAELRDSLPEGSDEQLKTVVGTLTDSVTQNASQVSEGLDTTRFGTFDVISSALNFNYSWKISACQHVHERHSEALSEEGTEALEQLIEVLELFGAAREYFKTLYFQWEVINLSRHILVASIPALVVSGSMVLFFDSTTYSTVVAGTETLVIVVALAATISITPFLLLLAYIVRIATVTKHTLAVGPFILRESTDVTELD